MPPRALTPSRWIFRHLAGAIRRATGPAFRAVAVGLMGCIYLSACGPATEEAAAEKSSSEAARLAGQLQADLVRVRAEAVRLSVVVRGLYENRDEILPQIDRKKFQPGPGGAFHKPVNDGTSALWISGAVPITESVKEVAYFTEPLDPAFMQAVRKHPEVDQARYSDRNGLSRVYPWFEAGSQYPPRMQNPNFKFYRQADAERNPGRQAVWIDEPYVDPAGRGWVVSVAAPVYDRGEMQGVVNLDLRTASIFDRYLKRLDVPLVVLARSGVVVAATDKAIELLEMPPLSEYRYLEPVKQDTGRPEGCNAAKSPIRGVRQLVEQLLRSGATPSEVKLSGRTYRAITADIPETGWKVVEFSPLE